ncbi:MAG: hypothetical protein IPM39_02085 [Chloroflexi bacterium]|nr:hypothetical protein [Chloroflexota bacterium]
MALQQQLEGYHNQTRSRIHDLQAQTESLETQLLAAQKELREAEQRARDLEVAVDLLRRKAQADSEGLMERLTPVFGDLVGRQVRESRSEMAEALGPVMGEGDSGADSGFTRRDGRSAVAGDYADGANGLPISSSIPRQIDAAKGLGSGAVPGLLRGRLRGGGGPAAPRGGFPNPPDRGGRLLSPPECFSITTPSCFLPIFLAQK